MFYIVWKDYDGYNSESFDDRTVFAETLIDLSRKEWDGKYGTEIILVSEGSEVEYEYRVDVEYSPSINSVNRNEKLYIRGDMIITNFIGEKEEVSCPICKSMSSKEGKIVRNFPDVMHSTLNRYKCNSCDKRFYA